MVVAEIQTAAELHVITWIKDLVAEALESVEPHEIGLPNSDVDSLNPSQLGVAVLSIWARIFSENLMWPVIRHVSKTFELLAEHATVHQTQIDPQ